MGADGLFLYAEVWHFIPTQTNYLSLPNYSCSVLCAARVQVSLSGEGEQLLKTQLLSKKWSDWIGMPDFKSASVFQLSGSVSAGNLTAERGKRTAFYLGHSGQE